MLIRQIEEFIQSLKLALNRQINLKRIQKIPVIKKMTAYMLLFLEETSLLKIKLLLVNILKMAMLIIIISILWIVF